MQNKINIGGLDIAVIILYLILIMAIGCAAWFFRKRGGKGDEYFLASKSLTWPVIGLALFSTNISTVHLVALAQEGYKNGLAYGNFEWMAAFLLIILSLFFAPFYIRSQVATLPDFLEKRYSRPCRDVLAVVSIVSALFIHIGFSLYTGAVVLEGMFGFDVWTSIIVIALLTGVYTIVGGLLAVVWTESVQTVVLLAGAIIITAIAYTKIGGWEGLTTSVDPVKLTVLRGAGDPSKLPWYAVMLGYPVIGLWYWCADQTIVQRVLGAKDENHARVGPLFAGFIKILPVFIFVLPGLLCLGLVNKGLIPAIPGGDKNTYAHMIGYLLPPGLKGLIAAALLAALMSTVSGALNSTATLFCYDIYKRWRPNTTDRKMIILGRWVTFIGMILAIILSRFCERFESIFQGVTTVICDIAPPITAVFVWGVFWRRASARAALITLIGGGILGAVTFSVDMSIDIYKTFGVPAMLQTFILFLVCSLMMFVFSMIYPHQHTPESELLVWDSPLAALESKGWPGIGNYKFLAGVLFVIMVILYLSFK